MSNIIDSIQLSGTVYTLSAQTSGGGNPTIELSQAQYDALVTAGTVQADTYYIITDAQAGDLTNYYTKTETNTLLNGKQATLVSGTNIKTINNESLLGSGNIDIQGGGGGKAISGGRGISVTTGETADTVSLDVPIYKVENGTGNTCVGTTNGVGLGSYNCFLVGENNSTIFYQSNSILCGNNNYINEVRCSSSQCFGSYNKINNAREFASGCYNNSIQSNSTFGDSGNTLFSVGNGTADNARHNAFEIRQNGDIYITSGGTDIKLQDNLGGGGASYSAGTGIDITNDVISVTGVVETSAITTAITSSSTDAQVPSAKAVYDIVGDIETLLSQI